MFFSTCKCFIRMQQYIEYNHIGKGNSNIAKTLTDSLCHYNKKEI